MTPPDGRPAEGLPTIAVLIFELAVAPEIQIGGIKKVYARI